MFNPNEHMMTLKGKSYLQVMWRLVWFREDHPNWNIDTTLISVDDKSALFTAKIYDENGKQVSSGHGSESTRDFGDYIEKAETKAIGRALAILGYGTQFAPELDEGERIVDSPVARNSAPKSESKPTPPTTTPPKEENAVETPKTPSELDYVITDGEFKGWTMKRVYKETKIPDLIADANLRKDKTVIENIRIINAYINECRGNK